MLPGQKHEQLITELQHTLCTHACSARQRLTHCSACPCRTVIPCTISCDGGSLFPGSTRRQLCTGHPAQWCSAGCMVPTSMQSCGIWVGLYHVTAAGSCHQRDGAPEVPATPWTTGPSGLLHCWRVTCMAAAQIQHTLSIKCLQANLAQCNIGNWSHPNSNNNNNNYYAFQLMMS